MGNELDTSKQPPEDKDETDLPIVRGLDKDVINWVGSREAGISEFARKAVAELLKDKKVKMQVFFHEVARGMMYRLAAIYEKHPLLEERLLKKEVIDTMEDKEVIRLFSVLIQAENSYLTFLQKCISPEELKSSTPDLAFKEVFVDTEDDEKDERPVLRLPPEGRRKMKNLLKQLLLSVTRADREEARGDILPDDEVEL